MRQHKRIVAGFMIMVILIALFAGCVNAASNESSGSIRSIDELTGKPIAVITGGIGDRVAEESIPGCVPTYFNSYSDCSAALHTGKVVSMITDEPIYYLLKQEYPGLRILTKVSKDYYGFIFHKNDPKAAQYRDQMNTYLAKIKADGTLDAWRAKWIEGDISAQSIDFDGLTGENGTLSLAISTESGAQFTSIQNGQYSGYEIEIAVGFCREYGYSLEISDSNFTGLLASVSSGKSDMGAGCITITEERKESMDFSEPDYEGGFIIIVDDQAAASGSGGIADSFNKTFIVEGRWQLFANGIGVTLLITLLSAVLGTLLGFGLYLIYRKAHRGVVAVMNILMDIMEKTPVVVILMILYYIVFGNTDLSGIVVSVIGFTLMFALSFISTLSIGVKAVDNGQMEAALAMGFSDRHSFMRVILPQAAEHFLPNYKSQIVSLLKDTAIVGYIAVQDLTKIGDIVRSRTYEAFFPLIATAVIYFMLAWILTILIRKIEFKFDPKKRSPELILKGVKTNDRD